MSNYAVSFKNNETYFPILVMEGDDEESVIQYFQVFRDMLFFNGVKDIVYLSKIDDEKLEEVETVVALNNSKSEKIASIVQAFLNLPDDSYRWN